jgi:hypothetical protein
MGREAPGRSADNSSRSLRIRVDLSPEDPGIVVSVQRSTMLRVGIEKAKTPR